MMVDLDHFKRCNDEFGHEAGDAVLRVGEFLPNRTRTEDIACRHGGEEFVVIRPEASQGNSYQRAQQIREGIKRLESNQLSLDPITVSIGLEPAPRLTFPIPILLEAADAALYEAKRDGRDRVTVHQSSPRPVEPLPLQTLRS
jgi:diguanylate cyclase (GGDEF)-like protein